MKLSRIRVWRFAKAPDELRALHHGSESPEWLVMVPRAMHGSDVDKAVLAHRGPGSVLRYETPKGDLVYIGAPGANP
jgi:hypothetical protein